MTEINLGCSGWFYWHWKGLFYPEAAPTNRWFQHYARTFLTVELNAPFYKWPRPSTVRGWLKEAPPGFRFTVKVNQEITHERRMVRTKKLVQSFYEIGHILGPPARVFPFSISSQLKIYPCTAKEHR